MAAYMPHITDAQQVLTDDEIIALMPDSLVFITKLIGVAHVLALIESFGGTNLVIPRKQGIAINNEIAAVIGVERLKAIAEQHQLGGTTLEIPVATSITQQMRNRLICQQAARMSRSKLARRYNLTIRQIRTIINQPKEIKSKRDDRQQDLFT